VPSPGAPSTAPPTSVFRLVPPSWRLHNYTLVGTLSDEDGITATPSPSGSATVTGVMATTL